MRSQAYTLHSLMQVLTKDSVTVSVDAVVYYRVFDPIKAAIGTMDYNEVMLSLSMFSIITT